MNKKMSKKMGIFVGSVLLVGLVAMVWLFTCVGCNVNSLPEASEASILRVISNPSGASVTVANIPRGEAPVNVVVRESMVMKTEEGDYVVRVAVSKKGYIPQTEYVSLGPNALDQNGKLVPGKTYSITVTLWDR